MAFHLKLTDEAKFGAKLAPYVLEDPRIVQRTALTGRSAAYDRTATAKTARRRELVAKLGDVVAFALVVVVAFILAHVLGLG